jgi:hypothetical protein
MMSVREPLPSLVDSDETTILVRGRLNQTIVVEPSGTSCAAELPSADDASRSCNRAKLERRFWGIGLKYHVSPRRPAVALDWGGADNGGLPLLCQPRVKFSETHCNAAKKLT